MLKHFDITVTGKVQGVYYRAYTQAEAQKSGICGFVQNQPNGDVFIEAEGDQEQLKKFADWCHKGSPRSEVKEVRVTEGEIKNYNGFNIKK